MFLRIDFFLTPQKWKSSWSTWEAFFSRVTVNISTVKLWEALCKANSFILPQTFSKSVSPQNIYIYIYIFSHSINKDLWFNSTWKKLRSMPYHWKKSYGQYIKRRDKRPKFYLSFTLFRYRMWGNSTLFASVKVHSSTYSGSLFVLHNFMYVDILLQWQSTIDACVLLLFLEIKSKSNKRNCLLRCCLTALKFASIHQVNFSCWDVKSSWRGG